MVVLAGGLGRRMGGGDKPLRPLAGRALLDHVLARVAPQAGAVALNANGDAGRFAAWGVPVVADTLPGRLGPLAGVLAGMRWARGAAAIVSVPGDTPFLPHDLIARLHRAGPLACAVSRGRVHPTVALWPLALAEALEAALRGGERRVEAFAAAHGAAMVAFPDTALPGGVADPFLNVNMPADLAEAERLLTGIDKAGA